MRPIRPFAAFALSLWLAACASVPTSTSPRLAIGEVQGSGARSPWLGREVTVDGVITADFSQGLGLWALQGAADNDPASADALFIADVRGPLAVGAHVRVSGIVAERDTGKESTVTTLEVNRIDALPAIAMPPAQRMSQLPADAQAWESLEAMRVAWPQPWLLAGTQNAARFGEWQLALGTRPWTPTERALPGAAANALARENRARMLWLDDGESRAAVMTAMRRDIPRVGSVIAGVSGIVDERFGRYRVQATAAPQVMAAARPPAPARRGELRIAAMNLENLFNGDGRGGGFPTERGARREAEYLHQRAKRVAALAALDADVIALMELENDAAGPLSSQAQLVASLNTVHGGDWRAVPMPANASSDAIRVGIIYRASKLRPVGAPATLDAGPFRDLSRPPLLQAFRAGRGPQFTVVANHFKSKGCSKAQGADSDARDGQGCWNATRLDSARRLDAWLRQRLGAKLDAPVVILGDLNAYAMEDPPRWLREAGWRDAFAEAGIADPYSYVYEGQSGRLDHALLTPALAARLQAAAEWHINADEANAPEADDAPVTPYRSSDHDPLVIDVRLRSR